jgi:hypothetical protein
VSAIYVRACAHTLLESATGPVANAAITEASGIVASRTQPGIYWVHNDSGDSARLFAIDVTGATRGTYNLSGVVATDFEDIALGPGPIAGVDYLHIGDIGDNTRTRTEVQVLRFVEPTVPATPTTSSLGNVETLHLTYPNGARNAESLLVDPRDGQITVVMKRTSTEAIRIYRAPANLPPNSLTAMTDVGNLNLPGAGSNATGMDMSRTGKAIAVRTYAGVFIYNVTSASTVQGALASTPCAANAAPEAQGEAIAFHADDLGFVTVSEGTNPLLNHRDL